MWQRSVTDTRRVIIVDVSGMFYRIAYGGATTLSITKLINGVPTQIDTTLPNYVVKQIHRWSNFGVYPTIVCFDCAGSTKSRKAYAMKYKAEHSDSQAVADIGGYKDGRKASDSKFYNGIEATLSLLYNGGVGVVKAELYEADDLVKAAVDSAKVQYPNLPIDVITGDADLLPLVDEQVSVFITSKKFTFAEDKTLEKRGYVQVRPYNYQQIVQSLSKFNNLVVPYNTILLAKMLRGDSADNIKGCKGITPTKYNKLIEQLCNDNTIDIQNLFRYDSPTQTVVYIANGQPVPPDLINTTPREQMTVIYGEPPALTQICNTLSKYVDDTVIEHIKFTYNYMNLNGAYTGLAQGLNRRPARLTQPIQAYSEGVLAQVAETEFGIHIPLYVNSV